MNHAIAARRATWDLFRNAAAATAGFASPLYRAALRARQGRDPAGEEFCAVAARLPPEDRPRLLSKIERLDIERAEARSATL